MPKGILFDHAGNLSAIKISAQSVLSDLYEHLGTQVVKPLLVQPDIALWVDAAGADQPNATVNRELTRVAGLLGLDHDVYGEGVFVGCPNRDTTAMPVSLDDDQRSLIVLTHVRQIITSN